MWMGVTEFEMVAFRRCVHRQFCLRVITCLFVECSQFVDRLPPELVAYWKLDETEGDIAYDSAAVNDAVAFGGGLWQSEAGKVNGALHLDGVDDCVSTPFILNPADGPFSVLAWVKGGAPGQVVISQQAGINWLMTDAEGKLMTGVYRALYVDDTLVAEDAQPGLSGSLGGLHIGCGSDLAAGTFWSGMIDDVRIYSRAMRP
jgi:hypothetical protein